jgi:hypothetical protein
MTEQHSPIIESRATGTAAVGCAIHPKAKSSILIDAGSAADGWIAATLAKCSTTRGRYLIQLRIGATKI